MSATATLPSPARPLLTARTAQRLCWRQEWSRHKHLWANGLAAWVFLFLIPGPTTSPDTVLGWSALWTGILAMAVAGYDLRHGIDPLVRGLALDGGRRWLMRLLIVLAGSWSFHLAATAACEWQWAHHLWQPVADGFFSRPASPASPHLFTPLQSLAVLAAVGTVSTAASSRLTGAASGVVYAVLIGTIFLVASLQAHSLPELAGALNVSPAMAASATASLCCVASLVVGRIALKQERTRAPIDNSARQHGWAPLALVTAFVLSTGSALFAMLLPGPQTDLAFRWMELAASWWNWLLLGEALIFGLWVMSEHRKGYPSPKFRSDTRRLLPLALIPFGHLLLLALSGCASNFHWPLLPGSNKDLPAPRVSASQSWTEATAGQQASNLAGYDAILWSALKSDPLTPRVLKQATLDMNRWHTIPLDDGMEQAVILKLVPAATPGTINVTTFTNFVLEGSDRQHTETPPRGVPLCWEVLASDSPTDLTWHLVLIPRFGAATPRSMPFRDVVPPQLIAGRQFPPLFVGFAFDAPNAPTPRSGPRILGFEVREPYGVYGLIGVILFDGRAPGLMLASALLVCLFARLSRRPVVWALVGTVALLLLLAAVDAVKLRTMLRAANNPALPLAERNEWRDAAAQLHARSYFQRPR